MKKAKILLTLMALLSFVIWLILVNTIKPVWGMFFLVVLLPLSLTVLFLQKIEEEKAKRDLDKQIDRVSKAIDRLTEGMEDKRK